MVRNSLKTAVSKSDFHTQLEAFLGSGRDRVGDVKYGQTAWTWVKSLGNRYFLNADSTAEGVKAYLALVEEHGADLKWSVVMNERGRENKAAFGPDKQTVEGFYFYRVI